MTRIEIFDDFNTDVLEERVNVWFKNHFDREIISTQFIATPLYSKTIGKFDVLKTIVVTHKETK